MKIIIINIVFLILALPLLSLSQKVENIHFEQVGKQIHIYYDLQGDQSYTVQVFCSTDNGQTWGNQLKFVIGEVGVNQKQGYNKEIIWDVLLEKDMLKGNIIFKIDANTKAVVEMVFVKGGKFQMGSNDIDAYDSPVHTVAVDDFYIGKYEVTIAQFKEFIDATDYQTYADKRGWSYIRTDSGWKEQNGVNWKCDEYGHVRQEVHYDYPVMLVSWNDIIVYCEWLSSETGLKFRLPTEAEWEYAAIGGVQTHGFQYSGSNNIDEVAWYNINSGDSLHKVGTKKPNELGIYDMTGNIYEWCNDWYDENFYQNSPMINPQGPKIGTRRVLRGGIWVSQAAGCTVDSRSVFGAIDPEIYYGFRLARDVK